MSRSPLDQPPRFALARPLRRRGRAAARRHASLDSRSPGVMSILDQAEALPRRFSALCFGAAPRSRPNIRTARSPAYFKPNGSVDPDDPEYVAERQQRLRRLEARGRRTGRTADEAIARRFARRCPSRSQITRHDCVEGWSCIGQWKGARLSALLDAAGLKPQARFIAFFCADTLEQTLDDNGRYYETIDLVDAFHPQTILAYEMNYAPLHGRAWRAAPAPGRAPARLQDGQIRDAHRGDRQLRSALGRGRGGYWEDRGYEWYAGI